MKKLILSLSIFLIPALSSAQTTAFVMGGISMSKSIQPSGEAGFYCEFNRVKVGMNFTYTQAGHDQPDLMQSIAVTDNGKVSNNLYTASLSLGPVIRIRKVDIMPAIELGAAFTDQERGAAIGGRADFKYSLSKRLSILSDVYLSHARLKAAATNYGARAGISFTL